MPQTPRSLAEIRRSLEEGTAKPTRSLAEIRTAAEQESRGIRAGLEDVATALRHPRSTIKRMARSVVEDYRKATNPNIIGGYETDIIGYNPVTGDPIRKPMREARIVSRENPDAQTFEDWAGGARRTAINAGFAAAPAFALPARAAINASLGALESPEDRLRGATAGLLLGETLHQAGALPGRAGRAVARATDVSEGAIESAAADMARATRGTSPPELMGPRRPAAGSVAAVALERAEGGAPRRGRLPNVTTVKPARGKLPPEPPTTTKAGIITESGGLTPRPPRSLAEIRAAVEQPGIVDVSGNLAAAPKRPPRPFGEAFDATGAPRRVALPEQGVRRRPATEVTKELEEPPHEAGKVPEPEPEPLVIREARERTQPGEIKPVAIATPGEGVTARPGMMGRVNRELTGRGPQSTAAPLPRIRPDDIDRPPAEPMISVAEATRRIEAARKEAEGRAPKAPAEPATVTKDTEGRYLSARNDSGSLRDVRTVSDTGLIKELSDLGNRMQEAARRSIYRNVGVEGTDVGEIYIQKATRKGGGPSMQAKALQNIQDMERVKARIEGELKARGYDDESIGSAMWEHYTEEEALTREGQALREGEGDDSFDFTDESDLDAATTTPAQELPAAPARPNPRSQPREFLNWTRANYNKTVEARIREAVDRGREAGTIDKGYQSFEEQGLEAVRYKEKVAKDLLEDPLTIDRTKLGRLTGAEIEGLKLLVGENAATMEAASRVMNDPAASAADIAQATELFDKASSANDQALSKIVTETAQTARSLGYMRNMAKHSLDPEVWLVQAKRVLGDQPMSDATMIEIRRLAREAAEACT